MPRCFVAIVGSADPGREDYELPLRDADLAERASQQLGRELAKAGFGIVVYSGDPAFIEPYVVKGFVESGVAEDKSIRVCFPRDREAPTFGERAVHGKLFDFRRDRSDEWESSFYRSLNDVDGVLLLGGGRSTLVAGYIALGRGIPVLAIHAFGGNARRIWAELNPGEDLATPEDIRVMGEPWSLESPHRCVETLLNQHKHRQEEAERRRSAAKGTALQARNAAGAALVLLILTIGLLPIGLGLFDTPTVEFLFLLFFSGLVAGASGSTIRLVWQRDRGHSLFQTGVLGAAAGGVAALLFILAQAVSVPQALGIGAGDSVTTSLPSGLLAFTVAVGFVAGFTFDAVYKKLSTVDALQTGSLTRQGS